MESRFIALNNNIEQPVIYTEESSEIVNFGTNNDIPQLLLKYFTSVGLNRAIINKKKNMFLGKGIAFDVEDDLQSRKTLKFLDEVNQFENINDLMEKVALDMFLYGGTYLQIIWSTDGKKITEIYHMPYHQMRSGTANEFGFVTKYYYNTSDEKTDKWARYTSPNDKHIVEFNAFNTQKFKNKPQILYIKQYEPSNKYYTLPDYIGALLDLDTMASISDFHNANIHNNMQPGLTIFFRGGEPPNEKKDAIVKAIKEKYGDTANAGRPMVFFLDTDIEPKVEQAEVSNVGDMYSLLSEDVKENILVSHQIPRAVSGLANPGSLGNTKELVEGLELVRNTYIKPIQDFVLGYFNKIMNINGLKEIFIINPSISLMRYNVGELTNILTRDEIREFLGYDALENQVNEDIIEEDTNTEENE